MLDRLRDEGLSERHARALLRLDSPERQREALDFIIDQRMNVAAAEEYVERLCGRGAPAAGRSRRVFLLKDVRLLMNTMERSLGLIRSGGVDAALDSRETEEELVLTVRIPKTKEALTK